MPAIITRGAASVKAFGWSGKTGAPPGQQAYTTAGSYSFVVPAGVTKVSMVAIGGGQGAGTAVCLCLYMCCVPNPYYNQRYWVANYSGNLAYSNNKTVTPGSTLAVTVPSSQCYCHSSVKQCGTFLVSAGSGTLMGCVTRIGGAPYQSFAGVVGGAGAAGYSTNGTQPSMSATGTSSTGGGGGSGNNSGSGGGGTGILGLGSNGAGATGNNGGGGGSGGAAGGVTNIANGGAYGGGAGSSNSYSDYSTSGGGGAVRIVWPGCARSYPSTRMPNE